MACNVAGTLHLMGSKAKLHIFNGNLFIQAHYLIQPVSLVVKLALVKLLRSKTKQKLNSCPTVLVAQVNNLLQGNIRCKSVHTDIFQFLVAHTLVKIFAKLRFAVIKAHLERCDCFRLVHLRAFTGSLPTNATKHQQTAQGQTQNKFKFFHWSTSVGLRVRF